MPRADSVHRKERNKTVERVNDGGGLWLLQSVEEQKLILSCLLPSFLPFFLEKGERERERERGGF